MAKPATHSDHYDIAIVGYGPTGATLASLLGARGLRVAVFDREPAPLDIPRAVHFDGEVMRVFQSIGLASEIEKQVRPSLGQQYWSVEGEVMMERKPSRLRGPSGWADNYLTHQPDLEVAVRKGVDRFPNVVTFLSHEVNAVVEGVADVALVAENLASGEERRITASWVVGCDGGRSLLRRVMDTKLDDLGFHQPWLVIDLMMKHEVNLPALTVQFCDPARPTTIIRLPGQRRRWEMMVMPGDDVETLARPENIWPLLSRWVSPADGVIERGAIYTFHSLIAEKWRKGRLLLAGDAAHQTPPFLGQGMCAGVRDAANLEWKLALVVKGADPQLLDTYESERIPHVHAFISGAVSLGRILQTTDPEKARERNHKLLSGTPVEMVNLSPPLGRGQHVGTEPAGVVVAQPTLADGRLLDDAAGGRFTVAGQRMVIEGVRDSTRDAFDSVDTFWTSDPGLAGWLEEIGAAAVVLRPDRYVLGIARTVAELDDLASLLPRMAMVAEA